jgi:hypothetical protein
VEGAEGGATFGRTDEKGKAVIALPGDPRTGEYRVYAGRLDPGRMLYWARSRFPGTQTSLTVTYHRRSEIQGIASDADGQRLQGAQIRVRVRGIFPAGDPGAAVFQKLMKGPGEWELQRRADAAGMFRLDHLSSDLGLRFDFAALEEGQGQSIETDMSQEADGPSSTVIYRAPAPAQYSVLLTRNRAGVVSAGALTWDGLPVPQALLSFRVESGKNSGGLGPRAVLRTDGLGRGKAPWKDLADGSTPFPKGVTRYWAAAWKKGHGLAYSSGTLDPARPEVVVRFPKGQTGPSIQAQVLDQASLVPFRNAEVRITSTLFEKASLAELKTDPKGNFSLEGLQAPDASFSVSLDKGFRFFAEVRPPGAGTDPAANSPEATEVRPGAPGRILLPRKP